MSHSRVGQPIANGSFPGFYASSKSGCVWPSRERAAHPVHSVRYAPGRREDDRIYPGQLDRLGVQRRIAVGLLELTAADPEFRCEWIPPELRL
jgi:hypothetical protein